MIDVSPTAELRDPSDYQTRKTSAFHPSSSFEYR